MVCCSEELDTTERLNNNWISSSCHSLQLEWIQCPANYKVASKASWSHTGEDVVETAKPSVLVR